MSRMTISACGATALFVLAGFLLGRSPVESVPATPSHIPFPSEAAAGRISIGGDSPPPAEQRAANSSEMRSILAARQQLGSVLEGSSLDDEQSGAAFVESLERLIRR